MGGLLPLVTERTLESLGRIYEGNTRNLPNGLELQKLTDWKKNSIRNTIII